MKSGIVIRRRRLKFRRAGIHHLIAGQDVHGFSLRAYLVHRLSRQLGYRDVRKPHFLGGAHEPRRQFFLRQTIFHVRDIFYLAEEPLVHFRDVIDLIHAADPTAQGFRNDEKPLIVDSMKIFFDPIVIPILHLV